jgi:hypothetical protein
MHLVSAFLPRQELSDLRGRLAIFQLTLKPLFGCFIALGTTNRRYCGERGRDKGRVIDEETSNALDFLARGFTSSRFCSRTRGLHSRGPGGLRQLLIRRQLER